MRYQVETARDDIMQLQTLLDIAVQHGGRVKSVAWLPQRTVVESSGVSYVAQSGYTVIVEYEN